MVAFAGIGVERSMAFVVPVCWIRISGSDFYNTWPLLAMMPDPLFIL